MTALAGCWRHGGGGGAAEACRRMLASQAIYGPHHTASWDGGAIALGRGLFRLLPEDRHDRGVQASADGRHRLVADVRLDNRSELAEALGLDGSAAAMPDAAIVLAAWRRWQEGALDRLVGDFAFALWDEAEQTLHLATDFLGQRPLHYHRGNGFFAFATMPKGLHALPEVPYAPDPQAMAEFVVLLPEGDSRSFFEQVAIVEPGHLLAVTRDGLAARRYWNPGRPELRPGERADCAEGLRHHLDVATRARLRGTDGAVGAHLSAGLDSSAVAATAAREMASRGGRVVAFTAVPREGYAGPPPKGRIADEGPLAAATAALHANIEHVLIRTRGASPVEGLDRDFHLYGRPVLNLCNGTWQSAICQAARDRGLTVLLTGQMGNATLSYHGGERLPELLRERRWLALWKLAAALVNGGSMSRRGVAAAALGPYLPPGLWRALLRLRGARHGLLDHAPISPACFAVADLAQLAGQRALDLSYRPRRDGFETRLWMMRRTRLGSYTKGILAGWGIDQRDPTADRRLAEYCVSLPTEAFLADGRTRGLARRALGDRLPRAVIEASGKGYQAADWHEGLTAARAEIAAEVERIADCGLAAATLDIARLRRLIESWPEAGWETARTIDAYRLALLRGISAGHFLRTASRSNR